MDSKVKVVSYSGRIKQLMILQLIDQMVRAQRYLNQMTNLNIGKIRLNCIKRRRNRSMKCPVCNSEVDMFDICENCNYQNSGPNENLDGVTGPNKMTLAEARKAYEKREKIR